MNQKYTLQIYNTLTGKFEETEVSEEIYHTYRRTGWNIKDNDSSFFDHEIQFSALIDGNDDAFENFREFISSENDPENAIAKKLDGQALTEAFSLLDESEMKIV